MPLHVYTQKNRVNPALVVVLFVFTIGSALTGSAQAPPLNIFKNYFVTGDYVVAGWVESSSANGQATGTISVPDCRQAQYIGIACPPPPVPAGADIVSAYLYWGTVEGSQSTFVGQQASFNGYKIVGDVLGNPNAPTSWSSGGCTGSSGGSKTMRFYRADVRPYLPLDLNSSSPTFGALVANGSVTVKMADSGSNGNTQPIALGATLVVIYRVLSPHFPLNAVVLYDGSYAPSNGQPTMTQDLVGFYQPSANPTAKLTHIVANGQMNKGESASLTSSLGTFALTSLYIPTLGLNAPPFPGIYGAWDNPTWNISQDFNGAVPGFDTSVTTSVSPASTNSGCVNWGAIVFSTTVQDTDGDGLLDVWEGPSQGYTDAVSGNFIALPGADPSHKDLFVETDYLALRGANNNILHSHLPKQAALDAVGAAFAAKNIDVHFDLPSGIYSGDTYVVSTVAGAGGNEISESALVCTDPAQPAPGQLCAFSNQPAVSWKGGLLALQNGALAFQNGVGAFQAGRTQSYHYALFGHSMGEPRFYWSTVGSAYALNDPQELGSSMPQLVKVVVSNNTATVTIKSPSLINGVQPLNPPLVVKPGDCSAASPPPACLDGNQDRVTIAGALLPGTFTPGTTPPISPLNGTYTFCNVNPCKPNSTAPDPTTGMITTTFQITTANVPNETYDFSNEPQLGVSYLGPTSSSGHGDFGGGGDLEVTFGLWGADNAPGCQHDPSQTLGLNQVYCDDQVGTLKAQTGTLMHELGHTLTLAHGATYYNVMNKPSVPTYDLNCKPNFLSVMNYLFQIRGFADGGFDPAFPLAFDYSVQTLPDLNETTSGIPPLSESSGLGYESGNAAAHLTRWYSRPNNPGDAALQDWALGHCDGSPLASTENPSTDPWVRVEGTVWPGGDFSQPFDWNNDLTVPNNVTAPGLDLNHNGIIGDGPFKGFNDWNNVDFQQMSARSSGFGFSEGGGLQRSPGGGLQRSPGGGTDPDGGGLQRSPGGGLQRSPGGGLQRSPGGGLGFEHNAETANFTVDPPSGLNCKQSLTTTNGTIIPACTGGGPFVENSKSVPLTWTSPDFGQIRSYSVWRALGSFPTVQQALANIGQFSKLTTLTGQPPVTSFIDSANLKTTKTYTYFVTDSNKLGAKSTASTPLVVTMK
jgi:hypothetical protein